jgi:hypothetical protein
MKLSFCFILFLLFVSCNNTTPPQVVSGLEEPSQAELDSIKNISAGNKTKNAIAQNNSKSLLYANKGIVGVYLGTIGEKYFKLSLDKIYGDNAEGYVIIGTDKKLIKGKINKLGTEPSTTGDLTIYRLILSESVDSKINGEYVITLLLSAKSNSGEGAWISKNKKQQKSIVIKERAL